MRARRQATAVVARGVVVLGLAAAVLFGCGDDEEDAPLCPNGVITNADGAALQTGHADIDACLALAAGERALYDERTERLREACAAIVLAFDPDAALPDTGDPKQDTRQACLLAAAFVDTVLGPNGSLFCVRDASCDDGTLACSVDGTAAPQGATLEGVFETAGVPICSADCYLPDEALRACALSLVDRCGDFPLGGCDCAIGASRAYSDALSTASALLSAMQLVTGDRISCATQ